MRTGRGGNGWSDHMLNRAAESRGPLRVVSVLADFRPVYSGEGEWWLRIVPRLRARGLQVEILTRASDSTARTDEVIEGTPVYRLGVDKTHPYRSWICAVVRALIDRRGRFDVAQFHAPNNDAVYASCVIGRLMGWKTVYKMTLVGSDDLSTIRRTGRFGMARLGALHLAHGYVAMSPALTRGFEQARFLRDRLLVVPQGVDTDSFRPALGEQRNAARRRLRIPESAPVALFCGAIIHRKGVDVLIEAWREVRGRVGDALLLLVGPNHRSGLDQPEHRVFSERIERRIAELGLEHSVRLLGYHEDVRTFYAAANLFVFPSRAEGQPAVIGEALASGLPCVLSQLDGISEDDLRHGQEGVVVRSFEPADYADPMIRLLTDAEAATAMGRRARQKAVARFDIERIADSYAAFLRSVGRRPERVPEGSPSLEPDRGVAKHS